MILAFDLDDTLYEELTYVQGGLKAVSRFLGDYYHESAEQIYQEMLTTLEEQGRGKVFDDVINKRGRSTKSLVKRCLSIYRHHQPQIALHPDAENCLKRFNNCSIYLVTDGNYQVQYRKVQALGLEKIIKHVFLTSRYGLKNAKPSPYCFLKIASKEKVSPKEIVYIGDNPKKDFVGIRPLGFKTVRLLRGAHRDVHLDPSYEADATIKSLDELTEEFIGSL